MACGDKVKQTCGDITYATCVEYQKELPEFSEIDGCPTIEETTEEQYNLIGDIREQVDLSELGENCLTYIKDEEGRVIVKNVLLKYESEICELKQQVAELQTTDICSKDITECGINFGDLSDDCGDPITTLGQALTVIFNELNP